jgi:hypothetical protein
MRAAARFAHSCSRRCRRRSRPRLRGWRRQSDPDAGSRAWLHSCRFHSPSRLRCGLLADTIPTAWTGNSGEAPYKSPEMS